MAVVLVLVGPPAAIVQGAVDVFGEQTPADPPAAQANLAPALASSTDAPVGKLCYAGMSAFEPSMGHSSNDTLFVQAAEVRTLPGLLVGEIQRIARSWGECNEWQDVTLTIDAAGVEQAVPPQSNDPIVHVDPVADRVFNLDMQGLQCNFMAYSDDLGESWSVNPSACGQPAGLQDHPSIATGPARLSQDQTALDANGYPNMLYLCANRLVDSACARSLDGGRTFGASVPLVFGGDCIGSSLHHFPEVGPDGFVYVGQADGCDNIPTVAVSSTDALSWVPHLIAPRNTAKNHDVDIATTANGTVVAGWIEASDNRPRLAYSQDNGQTWSSPIDFAPSSVETTSFLALEAGAAERVGVAYYSTGADTGANGEVPDTAAWNFSITVSTDLLATNPSFNTTKANGDDNPVARGPCNSDNRCEPPEFGGSVGDFTDADIDESGRFYATGTDVCEDSCEAAGATEKSGDRGFVAVLDQGPTLRGPLTSLSAFS